MVVATRAAFTGSFPDAEGRTIALTSAPDGGWTQVTAPKAIQHQGVLYFAFIDGDDGHVKVAKRQDKVTTLVTVGTAPAVNTHSAPVIHIRPDGRILVWWSGHGGASMFQRLSTNPVPDISAWGSTVDLDSQLGGTAYTYPSRAVIGSDLYLFYRDEAGGSARVGYSISADDGATWAAQTVLVSQSGRAPYFVVSSDGSRIDMAVSTGHPGTDSPVSIHHLYTDGSGWKGADGSSLGSPTFTASSLPTVYDSGDGPSWPTSIITDGSTPTLVHTVKLAGDVSYRYVRWSGGWSESQVALANVALVDPAPSPVITAPGIVWAPVKVASRMEMHRYALSGTWQLREQTTGSSVDNIYPARIEGDPGALWLRGTYTTFLDNALGVMLGR